MNDETELGAGGSISDGMEAIGRLAKNGLENASAGMREFIGGSEIGASKAPEMDHSRSMPLKEALQTVGKQGLDPVCGEGFERHTHSIAKSDYEMERERNHERQKGAPTRDV